MAYNYDAVYHDTPNALGAPTPEFVRFFSTLDRPALRVLDVGCGQGRDALFIARAGHSVVGVDLSPSGIRDLVEAACDEGLDVDGIVADITTYHPKSDFDVILIDRTLHMLSTPDRIEVLSRLVCHVIAGGYLLIADERSNLGAFREVLTAAAVEWRILIDAKGFLFAHRPG